MKPAFPQPLTNAGAAGAPRLGARAWVERLLSRAAWSLSTRVVLSTIVIGLVVATAAGALVYRAARADQVRHAEEILFHNIATAEDRLASSISMTRRELLFLSRLPALAALVQALASSEGLADGLGEDDLRDQLASIFASLLEVRPDFFQLRLIGSQDDGREVVRVDRRSGGDIVRVPDEALQPKGGRAYFRTAVGLAAGTVHLSDFELNREEGALEVPHRSTYRLATPLHDPAGEVRGVLIANVDAASVFARTAIVVPRAASFFITNRDGDYLYHADAGRTFGFERGERYRIQDDIPEIGALFAGGPPALQATVDLPSGRHMLVAKRSYVNFDQPTRFLVTAALMPHQSIASGGGQLFGLVTVVAAVLAGAAAVAVTLLIHQVVRPIQLVTSAAADLSRSRRSPRLDRLTGRRDEVGEMARTFERMAETIRRREHDLTQRSKELARSNQELTQFAYVASHDLQEPLRMVASYLGLLARRYKGQLDQDADEFIAYAVDGAERMKRLINDLLGYSRVSNRALRLETVDAKEIVEQVLAIVADRLREAGATVTVEDLPRLRADGSQFERLITNLVDNALKYRSSAPLRLGISARRAGQFWEFAVADNGIGIDPRFHDKVFEIFARLHARAEYPGTGIGLSSCRRIVERHGGEIRVEPAPEGGSVFIFTLPDK